MWAGIVYFPILVFLTLPRQPLPPSTNHTTPSHSCRLRHRDPDVSRQEQIGAHSSKADPPFLLYSHSCGSSLRRLSRIPRAAISSSDFQSPSIRQLYCVHLGVQQLSADSAQRNYELTTHPSLQQLAASRNSSLRHTNLGASRGGSVAAETYQPARSILVDGHHAPCSANFPCQLPLAGVHPGAYSELRQRVGFLNAA